MTLAEVVQTYLVGAIATATFCTLMKHKSRDVRLDMRLRATIAWPIFWIAFAVAWAAPEE